MDSGDKLRGVERTDNEIVYTDVVALFYDVIRIVVDYHKYGEAENASLFPYFGAETEHLLTGRYRVNNECADFIAFYKLHNLIRVGRNYCVKAFGSKYYAQVRVVGCVFSENTDCNVVRRFYIIERESLSSTAAVLPPFSSWSSCSRQAEVTAYT